MDNQKEKFGLGFVYGAAIVIAACIYEYIKLKRSVLRISSCFRGVILFYYLNNKLNFSEVRKKG